MGPERLWHASEVKKCLFHRWFVTLGIVAILGALASLPLKASYALAMIGPMTVSTPAQGMPCQKSRKFCPHCSQRICPDPSTCLVKYFQPMAVPVGESHLQGTLPISRVRPASTHMMIGPLTPLLLRPPSA